MPANNKKRSRNRADDATPDLACTRCRERKIRCDRERPQCRNCERDEGATCIYQNPTKRINHLKLLCDSMQRLQDRLNHIESHLGRLSVAGPNSDRGELSSEALTAQGSSSRRSPVDDYDDDDNDEEEDEDDEEEAFSRPRNTSRELLVFRNQADMVDRYHGPSSLLVLCNHFRIQVQAAGHTVGAGPLSDILQNVREIAGSTELFPSGCDHSPDYPLPKQQAITAISHFFQHINCSTDIFVQRNLLANLERVYAEPERHRDDGWATCFKAITLLVLGIEVSAQAGNALFSDFARSCLPSRTAMVNPRLLSTPRLINVQTLILLSVAAQQFDPPGYSEYIFAHACMLARTMGLHHVEVLPPEAGADEVVERAKVLRALYIRDKSLCITRGAVSWLPSYEGSIKTQLTGAIEHQTPYSDRLRLAMIQDDVYRRAQDASQYRTDSNSQLYAEYQSMEHRLNEYARDLGLVGALASPSAENTPMLLEFLSTRILALQLSTRHAEQVRSDLRASCLLLLIAHGDRDRRVIAAFQSLTGDTAAASSAAGTPSVHEANTPPLASAFDAFSVPAFFILLEGLLQPPNNDSCDAETISDHDLLRRVSACYAHSTEHMQFNSYHRKVAWIFDQLLTTIDLITHDPSASRPPSSSMAEPAPSHPGPLTSSLPDPPFTSSSTFSAFAPSNVSSSPLWPTPPPTSTASWDSWASGPPILMPNAFPSATNSANILGGGTSNLLSQVMSSSQKLSSGSGDSMQWLASAPEPTVARNRSGAQTQDPGTPLDGSGNRALFDFLATTEEAPFHLISG